MQIKKPRLDETVMDSSIWWHYAVIIVPKNIRIPDAAMCLIVGWNNKLTNNPEGNIMSDNYDT